MGIFLCKYRRYRPLPVCQCLDPHGPSRRAYAIFASSSPRPWIDVFVLPEKSNMAVTESDPDPKIRKMSITDCATSELNMQTWSWNVTDCKKKYFWPDYPAIFSVMTLQRNVPRFCTRSICVWNLFQPQGLAMRYRDDTSLSVLCDPMFLQCWSTVYDAGPPLQKHWVTWKPQVTSVVHSAGVLADSTLLNIILLIVPRKATELFRGQTDYKSWERIINRGHDLILFSPPHVSLQGPGLRSITIDDYDYDYDYMSFLCIYYDYDYDYSSL